MGSMYEQFFPKWSDYYKLMLQHECKSNFTHYQSLPVGSPGYNAACADTALCMMENTVKNVESQTATTGVLLGLLPSVLSTLGSSPVEVSLLSTRRPLLSLLLALGAPVVNPVRLFEHVDPVKVMTDSSEGFNIAGKDKMVASRIVAVLEYCLALAAVVNMVFVSIALDTKSFNVVTACRWRSQIYVWTFSAVILHMIGLGALLTRARFDPADDGLPSLPTPGQQLHSRIGARLVRWLSNEFSTCSHHRRRRFEWAPENKRYLFVTAALAFATVVHIFYGTAILSSYQFLAPIDAVGLIARYIASTWVCRIIVNFELSEMASKTKVEPAYEQPSEMGKAQSTDE